jgi:hypothetical protein
MPPDPKRNKRPPPSTVSSDGDSVNLIPVPESPEEDPARKIIENTLYIIKYAGTPHGLQKTLNSKMEELTTILDQRDTLATTIAETVGLTFATHFAAMQTSINNLEAKVQALQSPPTSPTDADAAETKLERMEQRLINMQSTIHALTEKLANPPVAQEPTPAPEKPKPNNKPAWSEVASKKKPTNSKPTPPTKKQRTIVVRRQIATTAPLDSLRIRDAINSQLEKSRAPNHLRIVTVTTNQKNNIVLTTREDCTAITLLEFKAAILNAIASADGTPTAIQASQPWSKIMVHGIDTQRYPDTDTGMKTLQGEIESHTSLKLATPPRYATRPESRVGKTASSVVICLTSAEDASNVLKHRIAIDGTLHRTERFWAVKPTSQCHLCQRFGHHHKRCTHQPRCRLCAGDHTTTNHRCADCPSLRGKACTHIAARCCNCEGAHYASDRACPNRPASVGTQLGDEQVQEGEEMEL